MRKRVFVREDHAGFVGTQQIDELRGSKSFVPNLDNMQNFASFDGLRQQLAKSFEIGGIKAFRWKELPIDRPELFLEIEDAVHLYDRPCYFAGLFIVVAALEANVLTPETIAAISKLDLETTPVLSAITAVLSNLVSNVPAVLVLKPFIAHSSDPQRSWLIVAMASTLAGNFTLIGSIANLIVAQRARAGGVTIGFWAYFKVGAPLTILSILFGLWWL